MEEGSQEVHRVVIKMAREESFAGFGLVRTSYMVVDNSVYSIYH